MHFLTHIPSRLQIAIMDFKKNWRISRAFKKFFYTANLFKLILNIFQSAAST